MTPYKEQAQEINVTQRCWLYTDSVYIQYFWYGYK